jgi:hypothetical protein
MIEAYLKKSNRKNKKYMIKIENKTIHFGSKGMSDFTIHKDEDRKNRYIARHKSNENWYASGIRTAGFWSRFFTWNKPTINESISDIEDKFKIKIIKQL